MQMGWPGVLGELVMEMGRWVTTGCLRCQHAAYVVYRALLPLVLPPPVLHIYQHQCISHTHTHTNGRTDLDICIYNLKGFLTLRLALRCAWYHTKLLAVRVGCSGKFTRIDLSRSTRRSHQSRRQKRKRDQHLWPAINAAVVVPTPWWLMRTIWEEFEN